MCLPGATQAAKDMPTLECKLTNGAGAATRHLPQQRSDPRASATRTVPAILALNAEDNGE